MKRLFTFGAISAMFLMVLWPSRAATNLNSSRSNIYRMVYPADLMSQPQANTLLAELDKIGPTDEAKLKQWLPANFRRFGVEGAHVKKINIFLEQQISCASAATSRGNYAKGPKVCLRYGPIITPAQVRQVSKESPILILLLSDSAQEADALAKAQDAASIEKNPVYVSSREQARQSLLGKGGGAAARIKITCWKVHNYSTGDDGFCCEATSDGASGFACAF
jgi:hypothetical protein